MLLLCKISKKVFNSLCIVKMINCLLMFEIKSSNINMKYSQYFLSNKIKINFYLLNLKNSKHF